MPTLQQYFRGKEITLRENMRDGLLLKKIGALGINVEMYSQSRILYVHFLALPYAEPCRFGDILIESACFYHGSIHGLGRSGISVELCNGYASMSYSTANSGNIFMRPSHLVPREDMDEWTHRDSIHAMIIRNGKTNPQPKEIPPKLKRRY